MLICAADVGAAGMPGLMAASPPAAGAPQLTALPVILSSDSTGAPVFIAAAPPQATMFAPAPLTPLPSPGTAHTPGATTAASVGAAPVKSTAPMSLPLLHAGPPPPQAAAAAAAHGVFYQPISCTDPSAAASSSAPAANDVTSPVFDFPMTSPSAEICLQPSHPLHPANMTSYVH